MRERYFLWVPTWVHESDPPYDLSLPRYRWGWVRIDSEQRLDITRRNAIGFGVFAIGFGLTALVLTFSGCWC